MAGVHRVLRDDGLFLCVTFRPPWLLGPLLVGPEEGLRAPKWHMHVQELPSGQGAFPYYGYVLQKKNKEERGRGDRLAGGG